MVWLILLYVLSLPLAYYVMKQYKLLMVDGPWRDDDKAFNAVFSLMSPVILTTAAIVLLLFGVCRIVSPITKYLP
jgi:hypothetical protein|tara:strand:- start:1163 stop:1387 length:225 start_codon:yes stop_codon:yes gene_type:complete